MHFDSTDPLTSALEQHKQKIKQRFLKKKKKIKQKYAECLYICLDTYIFYQLYITTPDKLEAFFDKHISKLITLKSRISQGTTTHFRITNVHGRFGIDVCNINIVLPYTKITYEPKHGIYGDVYRCNYNLDSMFHIEPKDLEKSQKEGWIKMSDVIKFQNCDLNYEPYGDITNDFDSLFESYKPENELIYETYQQQVLLNENPAIKFVLQWILKKYGKQIAIWISKQLAKFIATIIVGKLLHKLISIFKKEQTIEEMIASADDLKLKQMLEQINSFPISEEDKKRLIQQCIKQAQAA